MKLALDNVYQKIAFCLAGRDYLCENYQMPELASIHWNDIALSNERPSKIAALINPLYYLDPMQKRMLLFNMNMCDIADDSRFISQYFNECDSYRTWPLINAADYNLREKSLTKDGIGLVSVAPAVQSLELLKKAGISYVDALKADSGPWDERFLLYQLDRLMKIIYYGMEAK